MIVLNTSPVAFDSVSHTYTLNGRQLRGITGTLIHRAFPNLYGDVPESVLRNAARKGSELHAQIEMHDLLGGDAPNERVAAYDRVKRENGLTTVANEYLVSDCETYASSIDIVCEYGDGQVALIDTKTTYDLHKDVVALQLGIYKMLFEMQNPHLSVGRVYALWLPNRDHKICKLIELCPPSEDIILALMDADRKDEPFDYTPSPDWFQSLESEYARWDRIQAEAQSHLDEIRRRLMEAMERTGDTTLQSGRYTVSYIPERTGQRFDTTAFKKDNPDTYQSYMRESVTKASLRITSRKGDGK